VISPATTNTHIERKRENPDKTDYVELEEASTEGVLKPLDENIQEVEAAPPQLRRSTRSTRGRMPQRYESSLSYLLLTDNGEPSCYEEALQAETKVKWERAMDSLDTKQTWESCQKARRP